MTSNLTPPSNLNPQILLSQQSLQSNPYQYDTHTELIRLIETERDALSSEHSADEKYLNALLHESMQHFHQFYPLTQLYWQKYLNLIDANAEKTDAQKRVEKFHLLSEAVMEYFMIDLEVMRLEILASIDPQITPNIPTLKDAWLDCLLRCAGDYWSGTLLYTTFFSSDVFRNDALFSAEEKRAIYRRAVLMPIKDVEKLWSLYWDWEPSAEEKEQTRATHLEKHLAKIQLVKRLGMLAANSIEKYMARKQELNPKIRNHFEKFISTLKAEDNTFEPIYAMYRRATTISCLMDELWEGFVDYLWKVRSHFLLSACNDAVRNCTWNAKLWVRKMAALERDAEARATEEQRPREHWTYASHYSAVKDRIEEIFVQAQTVGLSDAASYFTLFEWYCSFLRQCYDACSTEQELIAVATTLRQALNACAQYLTTYFPDAQEHIMRFKCMWARVEARKFGDYAQMRAILNELLEKEQNDSDLWRLYFDLEREKGDLQMIRALLERALISYADGMKTLDSVRQWAHDIYLECGTLAERVDWETRLQERAIQLKLEIRQRDKLKKAEAKKKEKSAGTNKQSSNQQNDNSRRDDASGSKKRKRPTSPNDGGHASRKKVKREPTNSDRTVPLQESPAASTPMIGPQFPPLSSSIGPQLPSKVTSSTPPLKNFQEETGAKGKSTLAKKTQPQPKEFNDELTVFMWKIPFSMKQRDVHQYFVDKGCNVRSAKLLRTENKKSKGQAFIRMLDAESVQKALALDHDIVRKMMVRISTVKSQQEFEQKKHQKAKQRDERKRANDGAPTLDERLQHQLPRIELPPASENKEDAMMDDGNKSTSSSGNMLSNEDFRKFLF